MKLRNTLVFAVVLSLLLSPSLYGCSKDDDATETKDYSTQGVLEEAEILGGEENDGISPSQKYQ